MRLFNFRIFRDGRWQTGFSLTIEGKYISEISLLHDNGYRDGTDCNNAYLVPGFVDLQLYGAAGHVFDSDLTKENIRAIHHHMVKYGTTGFLITLPSTSIENILKAIEIVRDCMKDQDTGLMGLHLEGPFINPEKRGAHNAAYIRPPDTETLQLILERGKDVVRMMTIAPEMFPDHLSAMLISSGILISSGHSNSTYQQSSRGFSRGIKCTTHLYNAMSQLESREPGLAGATLLDDAVWATIVADGKHVSYETIKITYRLKKDRLILISDSTFLDAGNKVSITGIEAAKKDNAYYDKEGRLVGSAISLHHAVKNMVQHVGVSVDQAISMATERPAGLLNVSSGRLGREGFADLVFLNDNLEIENVFFRGEKI